jgi:hypothetical protein
MGPTAGLVDLEKRKIWSLLGLQLTGWLVDGLVCLLVGWWECWWFGWVVGWLVVGFVHWLFGWWMC